MLLCFLDFVLRQNVHSDSDIDVEHILAFSNVPVNTFYLSLFIIFEEYRQQIFILELLLLYLLFYSIRKNKEHSLRISTLFSLLNDNPVKKNQSFKRQHYMVTNILCSNLNLSH